MSIASLLSAGRMSRLAGVASMQVIVQVIGFCTGILLVRHMAATQYGYYTLAASLVSMAVIFSDLGLANSVMAQGGRAVHDRAALGSVLASARALHRRMALAAFAVLVPCFGVLLLGQKAPGWQVAALTVLIVATAAVTVRLGFALSLVRVLGHVSFQQKTDLWVNLGKLAVMALAASMALDATLASLVNLGAAAVALTVLARHLRAHLGVPRGDGEGISQAMRAQVWKQAPNSLYYVGSTQLALWLLGIFGTAERVAEFGALSRLGAVFAILGAVSSALILPYFARHERPSELQAAFASINIFFALLLAALVALTWWWPGAVLWVLGQGYAHLRHEVVWMVVASTLATWGSLLYSVGCARGWVMPIWWGAASGLAAVAAMAAFADVSTLHGCLLISVAVGLASLVAALSYFSRQLRCHARCHVAVAGIEHSARP